MRANQPIAACILAIGVMASSVAAGMEFRTQELRRQTAIFAKGEINKGDTDRLRTLIVKSPATSYVALDSPGGSLGEGIKLGELIREKKIGTIVPSKAMCASACAFVLAGGVVREVEPDARVGVHMASVMFSDGAYVQQLRKILASRELSIDDSIRLIISLNEQSAAYAMSAQATYLQKMGVSLSLLFQISETHHLKMKWLSPSELRSVNLVNAE